MKKALVTGAGGFIGSHLVEQLVKEGYEVKAFIYYNSFNSWGWLDTFPQNLLDAIEIISGDIRDPNGVRNAVKNMDTVFHLAALIGIPYSYEAPDNYVDTNIKGTLNILQAARDHNLERVVVTSTSEVYGTAQAVPMNENHPRQGQSPYAATKIGADYLAASFYNSFELPVTIVRPFNTYGPRQSARAVIPAIITQLLNELNELKLGALHPTRDFVFVEDTARGFIEIAQSADTVGEEVNIATNEEVSIKKLADELVALIHPETRIAVDQQRVRPESSEVDRLLGDNTKIKKLTNWQPQFSLREGLERTIAWFSEKENLSKYKADIYNV